MHIRSISFDMPQYTAYQRTFHWSLPLSFRIVGIGRPCLTVSTISQTVNYRFISSRPSLSLSDVIHQATSTILWHLRYFYSTTSSSMDKLILSRSVGLPTFHSCHTTVSLRTGGGRCVCPGWITNDPSFLQFGCWNSLITSVIVF